VFQKPNVNIKHYSFDNNYGTLLIKGVERGWSGKSSKSKGGNGMEELEGMVILLILFSSFLQHNNFLTHKTDLSSAD